MYGAHALVVCLLWIWGPPGFMASSPFTADLRSGVTSSLPPGVTWHSHLTSGGNCICDRQGVLKLNLDPALGRSRAVVNMTFEYSTGFTFAVGDSATNNGFAGDSNTQQYDAEVHSVHDRILFYGRDNPSGGTFGKLYEAYDFVGINIYSTITLEIGDELATADNGLHYIFINSHKLFGLNGQSDSGGVNYDVYLSMNRVVFGTRSGEGLCRVSVQLLL